MTSKAEILWVYLDCGWLPSAALIGRLYREMLRGAPKYAFEFDRQWLASHSGIRLSADLENFPGRQFQKPGAEIFGCFSDAMPDRWGRLLLKRREAVFAQREERTQKTLTAFDMLCGLDDLLRMGALRFKRGPTQPFLNVASPLAVPPITSLRELADAAAHVEESEAKQTLPEEKWLLALLQPGSSLGGARPKATVRDDAGNLWIAKFPSRNDDYDVGAWERFAYLMAERAGIETMPSQLIPIGRHHAFLVKRFDRRDGARVHFASAMTLTGLTDGDGAANGHGYLDIVEMMLENCVNLEANLEALYRRVAFSICIGNADDHFRNHGFLLAKEGWTLSPAYDMNPTTLRRQRLLINDSTDAADLDALRSSAPLYFLNQNRADEIIEEVLAAMKDWQRVADELALPQRDRDMFADRFLVK